MDCRTLHLLDQLFFLVFSALNTSNQKTFRELQSNDESICGCFTASRMGFQKGGERFWESKPLQMICTMTVQML